MSCYQAIRLQLVLGLVVGGAACAASRDLSPGLSNRAAGATAHPSASAPHRPTIWEHASDLPTFQKILMDFPSRGHGVGSWNADVTANSTAAKTFETLRRDVVFPPGSILVEAHRDRRTGTAGEIFAKKKKGRGYFPAGGDWEYVVLRADGTIRMRGKLKPCARCHADAPSDFTFPKPRPSTNNNAR